MEIKQLQQRGKDIFPRTIAEAVVVHHGNSVKRLDQVLPQKIEQIKSDEFTITKEGSSVVIAHANKVNPVSNPTPLLITHDESGHITGSSKVKSLIFTTINQQMSYDGSQEQMIILNDDFEMNNNIIGLRWNNIQK